MRSNSKSLALVSAVTASLVVMAPIATQAQAPSRDQLVGSWATYSFLPPWPDIVTSLPTERPRLALAVMTLAADGSRREQYSEAGAPLSEDPSPNGKTWTWSGNVLQLISSDILGTTRVDTLRWEVEFRGQQLHVKVPGAGAACAAAYQRVDLSKPLPAFAPPSVANRAQLLGTWVAPAQKGVSIPGYAGDTLVLQSDSTWMAIEATPVQKNPSDTTMTWEMRTDSGERWYVVPGNVLWMAKLNKGYWLRDLNSQGEPYSVGAGSCLTEKVPYKRIKP